MVIGGAFIGRKNELTILQKLLDEFKNGVSNGVFINGEAGVGKTKLVELFVEDAKNAGVETVVAECSPYGSSQPYQPFLEFINLLVPESAAKIFEFEKFLEYSEIFVVNNAGLLMVHLSKKPILGKDKKIMSGMLTAIQDYVASGLAAAADTIGPDEAGAVYKFEYGDKGILIVRGRHLYIACVLEGEEHPYMRADIKSAVSGIESQHGALLDAWSGEPMLSDAIKEQTRWLHEKKYLVTKVEDIRLEEVQVQICDRICAQLQSTASTNKILLVIENIQWLDGASVKVLEYLCRLIQLGWLKNILICCTYRPGLLPPNIKNIVNSAVEKGFLQISLTPFTEREIVDLMLAYGLRKSTKFATLLMKMTGGNPYFLSALLQKFDVATMRGKDLASMTIPENISDFILDKIMESPEQLRTAEYAVSIGEPFSIKMLADAMGAGVENVLHNLEVLVAKDILTKKGEKYVVSNPIVFNAVYDSIGDRWKKMLHKNIGYAYETAYGDSLEKVVFQLAHHFSNTVEYRKAFEYNLLAGDTAAGRYAMESSLKFYKNALSLVSEVDVQTQKKKVELLEKIGDVYAATGVYPSAIKYMQDAKACAELEKQTELLYKIGRFYGRLGVYEKAITHLEEGLKNAFDNSLKCKLYNELGWLHQRKSEYDKALQLHRQAAKFAAGDLKLGALTNSYIGFIHWYKGDSKKAIKFLMQSHKLLKKTDDKYALANSYNNIGVILQQTGEYEQALTYFLKSYRLRKKLNDLYGLSAACTNLGNIYSDRGETRKALASHKKALKIRLKINDLYGQSVAHNNLAKVLLTADRWKDARIHAEASLPLKKQLADKRGEAIAHTIAACINLEEAVYTPRSESDKNKLKDCVRKLNESIRLCNKIQEKWLLAINYHILSETFVKMRQYKKASEKAKQALKLAKEVAAKDVEAECYRSIAVLNTAFKKWSFAKNNFEKSIGMLSKLNEKAELGKTYYEYALFFKKKNDLKNYSRNLIKAGKIFKEVGATKKVMHITNLLERSC